MHAHSLFRVNAVKMITPKEKPVIDTAGQVYQVH